MIATKSLSDFAAMQTASTENIMTLTETLLGFVARQNALGVETSCSMLKVATSNINGIYGEGLRTIVSGVSDRPADVLHPIMGWAMTYLRGMGDLSARSQAEMTELVESYMDESIDLINETLDIVAETAPAAPTAAATTALKSAISAIGVASKGMIGSTRQVTPLMMNVLVQSAARETAGEADSAEISMRKAA